MKRRTKTCTTRADGALVHRTAPIVDPDGRYLGATCPCGRVITTPNGGQSVPVQTLGALARPVRSKGHRARVAAARLARKRAKAQRSAAA